MISKTNANDLKPILHVVIPTFNEEHNLKQCLEAVFSNLPQNANLVVTIVDDYSNDRTVELAQLYPVNILRSGFRDAEISKLIGFKSLDSDFMMYLDADIEIIGPDWFDRLLRPLLQDGGITGSFPSFVARGNEGAWVRATKCHELELDPLLEYFCVSINSVVAWNNDESYSVCDFKASRVPPVGIVLYRSVFLKPIINSVSKFMDIDVPIHLASIGHPYFAYVRDCKMYHDSYSSLYILIKKRLRNLNKVFLPSASTRAFIYFSANNTKDILKVLFLPIYAVVLIPEIFKSYQYWLKKRDPAVLLRPFILPILTFVIIGNLVFQKKGRSFLLALCHDAVRWPRKSTS